MKTDTLTAFFRRTIVIGAITAGGLALGAPGARAENHLLLELDAGLTGPLGVEGSPGASVGGTFGVGGRIRGLSPAWYPVLSLGRAGYDYAGPAASGGAVVDRAQNDWALGGRMYLPLWERLRLVAQVTLGETTDHALVSRAGFPDLELDAEVFTVNLQTGLQYRLNNHLSVGMSADLALFAEEGAHRLAPLAAGLGDLADESRLGFGLTTTLHF